MLMKAAKHSCQMCCADIEVVERDSRRDGQLLLNGVNSGGWEASAATSVRLLQ